ncbi:hypothetical protein OH491_24285 [Termitidicoccus mucosus]|uniref:Uncharacterized protein n=1 Tax=Termitidicoccus mucosus TaxID=1184151 RepID=A0A178IP05_9BACT|nr:hypothetical protein AW736_02160 [Opitutaceae bacterium TSB47]
MQKKTRRKHACKIRDFSKKKKHQAQQSRTHTRSNWVVRHEFDHDPTFVVRHKEHKDGGEENTVRFGNNIPIACRLKAACNLAEFLNKNPRPPATLKQHLAIIDAAMETTSTVLACAFALLDAKMRRRNIARIELKRNIPYVGEDGDYHCNINSVIIDSYDNLGFGEETGEERDWCAFDLDVQRAVLGALPKWGRH